MESKPAVGGRGKQKAPTKGAIGANGQYVLGKEQKEMRNMKRKLIRAQAKVERLKVKRENDALLAAEKLKSKKRSKKEAADQDNEEGAPAPKKRKTKEVSADSADAAGSTTQAVNSSNSSSSSSSKKSSKKNTPPPQDALSALQSAAYIAASAQSTSSSGASASFSFDLVASMSNTAHIINTDNSTNNNTTNTANTTNTNTSNTTNTTTTNTTLTSLDAIHRFEEHLTESASLKDTARRQFFKHSNCFRYTGSKGHYILWAYRKSGEMSSAGCAWPSAFVRDFTHTVHAAMWHVGKKNTLSLVSVWAYAPADDEHNNYYLKAYQKDVSVFGTKCRSTESPITDPVCRGHLVSSNEYCVTDFHCAALDGISVVEIQVLEKAHGGVSRQN